MCWAHCLPHCKPLFKELKILTLPSLFIESALFARKTPDVFIRNNLVHNYNTKRANQLHVPQISSTLASKIPYYSSVKIYKSLPRSINQETSLIKFKMWLKEYLCEAAFYSIEELTNMVNTLQWRGASKWWPRIECDSSGSTPSIK